LFNVQVVNRGERIREHLIHPGLRREVGLTQEEGFPLAALEWLAVGGLELELPWDDWMAISAGPGREPAALASAPNLD
jgi:hypothetical protein